MDDCGQSLSHRSGRSSLAYCFLLPLFSFTDTTVSSLPAGQFSDRMWGFAHFKYQSIRQRDNDEEKIDNLLQGSQQRNGGRPLSIVVALSTLLAFILGMMVQSALTKATSEDLPHERSWAQSLQPKTSWARFRGRLYAESPYRGNPSKSIDDAWGRFTDNKWFDGGAVVLSVSEDDIRRSWKDGDDEWFNSTVRLDERNGGGYMATLEIFHQLHCLVSKSHTEAGNGTCAYLPGRICFVNTPIKINTPLRITRKAMTSEDILVSAAKSGTRRHKVEFWLI